MEGTRIAKATPVTNGPCTLAKGPCTRLDLFEIGTKFVINSNLVETIQLSQNKPALGESPSNFRRGGRLDRRRAHPRSTHVVRDRCRHRSCGSAV